MKIYVAGEVPRDRSPVAILRPEFGLFSSGALLKTYRQIKDAVSEAEAFTGQTVELKMPYADPWADELDPKSFVEYLRDEISQSDAVLTVFFPPGIAVAFEAQLASELQKPQAILVPRSLRIPRYLRALNRVVNLHVLEDVKMTDVLVQLTKAVHEEAQGFDYA